MTVFDQGVGAWGQSDKFLPVVTARKNRKVVYRKPRRGFQVHGELPTTALVIDNHHDSAGGLPEHGRLESKRSDRYDEGGYLGGRALS